MSESRSYDVLVLGGGAAGLFCAALAGQRGRRAVVLAFALPVALTAWAVEARLWLLEHDDGLYEYVERGLSKKFAQRGIGSEIIANRLRDELGETQERLDFAERMLAQKKRVGPEP